MIWIPFSKSLRLRSYEAAILTALNSNVWGGEGWCRQRASKCSYLCCFLHPCVVSVLVWVWGHGARARLCVGPASISAVTLYMTAANSSTLMQCTGPLCTRGPLHTAIPSTLSSRKYLYSDFVKSVPKSTWANWLLAAADFCLVVSVSANLCVHRTDYTLIWRQNA